MLLVLTTFAAKFGIETKELDDGLEVYGRPTPELKEGVSVHCYDDHRVAMAFSVLGTAVNGTILEEKRCVEKTWPNWWDDLQNKVCQSHIPCLPSLIFPIDWNRCRRSRITRV